MQIDFNPPLRDTVRVTTSSLLPQTQAAALIFTAKLSAQHYERLVQDGGKIQLWSDLPRAEETDGRWHELDFGEPAKVSGEAYTVPLGGSLPIHDNQTITLHLSIFLPASDSWTRKFSFTYRIAYPYGKVSWLGAYGRNGTLVVQQGDLTSFFEGLVLKDGWSSDSSNRARSFEVKNADGLEVIKVNDLSNFRIWALGKDTFLPNLKDASVVFAVPRLKQQGSLNLHPTFVIAASPGLTMTVAARGSITASGCGALTMRVHEMHLEMEPFLRQILGYSGLDGWTTLGSDLNSRAVVLAASAKRHPISAAVLPLWTSEQSVPAIRLELGKLLHAFGSNDSTKEFALFSSYNLQMHVFHKEAEECQPVLLQFDSNHGEFTLSPVFRLRTPGSHIKTKMTWAAALLSTYIIVPSPFASGEPLPTPPPSPHLQPIAHLSQPPHASMASSVSSVDSLPLVSDVPPLSKTKDEARLDSRRPVKSHTSRALTRRTRPPSQPRSLIHILLKLFFAPMTFFLRLFFRLFWSRILGPLRFFGPRTISPGADKRENQHSKSATSSSASGDALEHLVVLDPPAVVVENTGLILQNDAPANSDHDRETGPVALIQPEIAGDLKSQKEPSSFPQSCARAVSGVAGEVIFAELLCNEDMTSPRTTATVALFPVCSTFDKITADDENPLDATPIQGPNVRVEHAVRFLDGSDAECIVSKCDAVLHGPSNEVEQDTCYLLEYQLDWEEGEKGRIFCLSSPISIG